MKKGDIVYSGNIKCVYIGRKKGAYVVEMKSGRQVWHVSTLVRPTKRAADSMPADERKRWNQLAKEHGLQNCSR